MIMFKPRSLIALALTVLLLGCAGEAEPIEATIALTDVEAIQAYELSLDVVERLPDVHENIVALVDEHPDLRESMLERPDMTELESTYQTLASNPDIRTTIESSGLTIEDYLVTSMLVTSALMEVSFEDMADETHELPEMLADHHLEFVREHRDEIEDVIGRVQAFEAMYAY